LLLPHPEHATAAARKDIQEGQYDAKHFPRHNFGGKIEQNWKKIECMMDPLRFYFILVYFYFFLENFDQLEKKTAATSLHAAASLIV
jgi:hypothetical protein